jgi:hypothetical protein
LLDVSIQSYGGKSRWIRNSKKASINRKRRLKEAYLITTDKKYLDHNKRIYGQSILTNLWNESFAVERMLKNRELIIA